MTTYLSSLQLPTNLFLELNRKLSVAGDPWAAIGDKLDLLSMDDINYYQRNPVDGGNGGMVLQMWKESDKTYKDLVDALKQTGQNVAAGLVERHYVEQ